MKRLIGMAILGVVTAILWDEERRQEVMEKAMAIAQIANERIRSVS